MGKQTKVGVLVLVALVIFVTTVFYLGQQQHFWERKLPFELHFARTNGLQEGAQVSLSGVPIGSVTDMRFPADPGLTYIIVGIQVTSHAAPRIRANTVAAIHTFGLLGDRYIELTPGTPDAAELEAGAVISSLDPTDYEAVLGQSGDIVTNIVEVTTSLKDVLQTIQRGEGLLGAMVRNREFGDAMLADLQHSLANVQQTSTSLARILERVDRGEGLLGHMTRDTKESKALLASLNRSAQSLDTFTERVTSGHGTVATLVQDEAYAKRVLGNLDRSVATLDEILARMNRGDGTMGKLLVDPSLYDEAKGAVGGVRRNWLLRLYRGVGAILPFGEDDASAPKPATPAAPAP